MRDARAHQSQMDQTVLGFESAQRVFQIRFVLPKLQDGLISRPHNLADLVAGNLSRSNQLVFVIVVLSRFVGVQHELERSVDVERHDSSLQHHHGEDVDGAEHYDQAVLRARWDFPVESEINSSGQDEEKQVMEHHQLGPHPEVSEAPAEAHPGARVGVPMRGSRRSPGKTLT